MRLGNLYGNSRQSFGFSWRKVGVLLTSYRILFLHASHLNLLIYITDNLIEQLLPPPSRNHQIYPLLLLLFDFLTTPALPGVSWCLWVSWVRWVPLSKVPLLCSKVVSGEDNFLKHQCVLSGFFLCLVAVFLSLLFLGILRRELEMSCPRFVLTAHTN